MNLSKSETTVIEALWAESPLTVGQVIERIQRVTDWHANTIKTLLTRLLKKGAIARFKDGGRYFYRAVLNRQAVVAEESEDLLNRFFDGRMAPLVAHFADTKKLSDDDIKEIQRVLKRLGKRDA